MRTIDWSKLNQLQRETILKRPALAHSSELAAKVDEIIDDVRRNGDDALRAMTLKFDGAELDSIKVGQAQIDKAYTKVSAEDIAAIKRAKLNIERFHQQQLPTELIVETSPGIECRKRPVPIDRVGLYVPGGSAPLVSTVLMLAVPAKIAGCKTIVLSTPPQKDGTINPHLLIAASLCGVTDIFAVGGAQAIAAMAYGTASVPKVDKVFGPGNSWVTQAKVAVAHDPDGAALDMPAGPSEVMVVVDDSSAADSAAADLLSQAEHGPDSQVVLVSLDPAKSQAIAACVAKQLCQLSRQDIAAQALEHSFIINVGTIADALAVTNAYAPEHLIVLTSQARAFADQVSNAASIFIGPWTPESLGDYASGTNHVLPTYGYARNYSGLGTEAFMKFITYQEATSAGLADIGPVVELLADLEGLSAHRNAVSIRLAKISGKAGKSCS